MFALRPLSLSCALAVLASPSSALAQSRAQSHAPSHAPEADPSAAAPAPAAEGPDSLAEAEDLYNQGRTNFETADYFTAIDLWTQAYGLVSDAPENAAIKAALIYNIASAQEKAYDIDTDLAHLRQAEVLMTRYAASIPAMYGDGPEADAELAKVNERLEQLRARIDKAEAEAAVEPPPPNVEPPPPVDQPPPRVEDPKAKPLIIAGAVVAGLGVVGLGVMGAGLAMGNGANDLSDIADDDLQGRRDQFSDGERANALALGGGIAGGVLLVTGGVLLGIGLKKKQTGMVALTPVAGREHAGLQLRGRF